MASFLNCWTQPLKIFAGFQGQGEELPEMEEDVDLKEEVLHVANARCPMGLPIVKAWGYENETLRLPMNGSISISVDAGETGATVTAIACTAFRSDRLWVDGREKRASNYEHLPSILELLRDKCKSSGYPDLAEMRIRIAIAKGNVGEEVLGAEAELSTLLYCLAALLHFREDFPGHLSIIARKFLGGSCRCLYGGFVAWKKGEKEDGTDSFAMQLAKENHWPELKILALSLNDAKMKLTSTEAMRKCAETSQLLKLRAKHLVPEYMLELRDAIHNKSFHHFAKIVMQDTNQVQGCCMDAQPPIFFSNHHLELVMEVVNDMNHVAGENIAAYTFDSGLNVFILTKEDKIATVMKNILYYFPPSDEMGLVNICPDRKVLSATGIESMDALTTMPPPGTKTARWSGLVKDVKILNVGGGPKLLQLPTDSLLDLDTGLPKVY